MTHDVTWLKCKAALPGSNPTSLSRTYRLYSVAMKRFLFIWPKFCHWKSAVKHQHLPIFATKQQRSRSSLSTTSQRDALPNGHIWQVALDAPWMPPGSGTHPALRFRKSSTAHCKSSQWTKGDWTWGSLWIGLWKDRITWGFHWTLGYQNLSEIVINIFIIWGCGVRDGPILKGRVD